MLRSTKFLLLSAAVVAAGVAHAQGAGTPMQLSPGHAPTAAAPPASVKLPSNWKLVTGQPEPLTGQSPRQVMTLPKADPIIDGKSVATALVMQCAHTVKGGQDPQLIVIFTSLTGIGHFKNFNARYRFDEGPVHNFAAQSVIGKNHSRAIALPRYLDVSNMPSLAKLPVPQSEVDPGIEIAGASRLRLEFNFLSAGVTFLDFNVSGATQAIGALGCQ